MLLVGFAAFGLQKFLQRSNSPQKTLASPAGTSVLADYQGYTKGPFTAFMAPFNRGSSIRGKDYSEDFMIDRSTFPSNSQSSWSWPPSGSYDPIRSFIAVDYGNYFNTIPAAPIRPSQIRNISRLVCTYDLSVAGDLADFDAIIDFFLTSSPGFSKILFEVEIFLHTPHYAKSYSDSVATVGVFTASNGVAWKVSIDPHGAQAPDILLYPENGKDVLLSRVDLQEFLAWSAVHKLTTGSEFFNGFAIGVEPQQKDGVLAIHNFAVSYNTADGAR